MSGPATVSCGLCSQSVTKRSTLAINGKRLCRWHQEVAAFVEERERTDTERRQMASASRSLSVLMLVSAFRVTRAITGEPAFLLWDRLARGHSAEVIAEARLEVERRGEMGEHELLAAMVGAAEIAKRQVRNGLG